MSSVIGSEGLDVVLPEGVSEDDLSVSTDSNGVGTVVVENNVSGIEVVATEPTTEITGKKLTEATVTTKGEKGTESTVAVETKSFTGGTIENKGKSSIDVNVTGTNFKKSTIDAGENKKRDDNISFHGKASVNRSDVKAGKGDDTILFGKKVKFKGKTTIDLGKAGEDSIVIGSKKIKGGKLTVTSFTKKDTITIGNETYTYNDFKNGVEIPNLKVELA